MACIRAEGAYLFLQIMRAGGDGGRCCCCIEGLGLEDFFPDADESGAKLDEVADGERGIGQLARSASPWGDFCFFVIFFFFFFLFKKTICGFTY